MKIPMKLVYQYMVIFFNFSLAANHFHSLQVENCDSNSRLVVDEDDYGKLRLERVKVPVKSVQSYGRNRKYTRFISKIGLVENRCCTAVFRRLVLRVY